MAIAQIDPELESACGEDPGYLCEFVSDQTGSEDIAEVVDWFIERPLKILFIFFIAWIIHRIVRRIIDKGVERMVRDRSHAREEREQEEAAGARPDQKARRMQFLADYSANAAHRAETLGAVLKSLASVIIFSLAILMALGEFDISLGPLIAGAGVVGIALGFGAQKVVGDFLSGIFMLIEDQYGVGDVINVGEVTGSVEQVTLRTTRLRDVDGVVWFVPNGEIRRVANKSQIWSRSVLDVEVAYDTNLDHAFRVIKEAADAVWHDQIETATILEEPEVWGVEQFGESSIAIRLVVKTDPSEQWAVSRALRRRLKEAFDREGIEIPFPQRDVWMREPAAQGGDSA